jgi:hypothetical protein
MLPNPRLNALRAQYKLDALLSRTRGTEWFFVKGYRMLGDEIIGARVARSRATPLRSSGRFRNTVWLPEERAARMPQEEDPILVDSFELASFAAAEVALLELLGEFHVPVALQVADGLGDVGFVSPNEGFVAFLRGNSLHRLTQEHPTQPLSEVARAVDKKLAAKPEDAEEVSGVLAIAPAARKMTLAQRLASEAASVRVSAAQFTMFGIGTLAAERIAEAAPARADTEPPMVKIFSKGGWIEDDDELRFNLDEQAEGGEAEIEVFEQTGEGHSTRCRYTFKDGTWSDEYGGRKGD